jgi:hypothetical protein
MASPLSPDRGTHGTYGTTIEVVVLSDGKVLMRRDAPVPMLCAVIAALRC